MKSNKSLLSIATFLIALLCSSNVHGQEALYISTQTGAYTIIEGTGTASTDDNESGSCSCSSSGPIKYDISPTSIGISSTETVTGYVHPDPNAAPAAGTSADASITCDCSWNWLTWNEDTEEKDKQMSGSYSETRDFPVYSIQIVLPETMPCNCGSFELYYTSVFPEGGTVTWETPWGDETGNYITHEYDEAYKDRIVTATYTIGGITYSASSVLTCQEPYMEVTVGDCDGYKAAVDVEVDENCGDITWSGYGTENCDGAHCDVNVSPNISEENQKVTVTYTDLCNQSTSKTVEIGMAQLEGLTLPLCATADPETPIYTRSIAKLKFSDGCEPNVTFNPVELTISEGVMEEVVSVTASEGDRSYTANITLVNPEVTIGSDDVNAIVDALGVFSEISEMINEANELIGGVTPGFSFEIETTMPSAEQLKESISVALNRNCCIVNDTEELVDGVKVGIGVSGGISISGTMPIVVPPIPPVIAYVEVGLGMGVDASVSLEGEAKCPPLSVCGNISVSSHGSASGSIKILAGLASGTVSADLNLVSGSGTVCVTYAPLDGTVSGELTLGGLTLNAQVCAGISFFEHCFPGDGPASVTIWNGYTIQIQQTITAKQH